MPDLYSFDPDDPVFVSPRHLAGPGLEQPPLAVALVWSSLTTAGWTTYTPDNDEGPLLCTSPCQLVRTARMPNSTDSSWKTAVYEDALAAPRWTAAWSAETPVELITDFHHALDQAQASGSLHLYTSATAVYLPLLTAGWSHIVDSRGDQMFTDPSGFATLTKYQLPHHGDAWSLNVLPRTTGSCRWSAEFSQHAPNALVAAFTASLADTTPVYRRAGTLPKELGSYLVTEPAPAPAPGRSEAAVTPPALPPAAPGPSNARRR